MLNRAFIIFLLSMAVFLEAVEPSSSFVRAGPTLNQTAFHPLQLIKKRSLAKQSSPKINHPLPSSTEGIGITICTANEHDQDSIATQASIGLQALSSLIIKHQWSILIFLISKFHLSDNRSNIDRPPI